MVELILRWGIRGAWAPITVIVIQQLFSRSYEFDWLMHFFGGAAIAFFLYQGMLVFDAFFARPLRILLYIIVFGMTCSVVIAWEVGELVSDRFLGSQFQASVAETIIDQVCGVFGAIILLACTAAVEYFIGNQNHRGQ